MVNESDDPELVLAMSQFEEWVFELIPFQAAIMITRDCLEVRQAAGMVVDSFEAVIKLRFLSNQVHNETSEIVPISWWDHWKMERGPRWLRRRYPPRTRRIVTQRVHVCPHWHVPQNSSHHLRFLRDEYERPSYLPRAPK